MCLFPEENQLARLVTASFNVVQEAVADFAGQEVHWVSGSGPGRKRI